ncbi:alpha/beta fold hydrolase [Acinetobacter rudis]|uniref:Alpha/beta fold hydrolase n=1 Tax=Acinetobacter rudis TaxID=632955 RepID=A0AAW8J894_9GAMM|nr:alpha/beta fold hydrolase [Acinetobacter rudis]MDQ8935975.1 alpha/beta fold hydrolase [Acinetobacter rudis]MDQ9018238.1 alpha/beta fold hydrolase [Acinetobacter rudis]
MRDLKNRWQYASLQFQNLSQRIFNTSSLVISEQMSYISIFSFGPSQIRYYAANKKKFQEPLVFIAPLAIDMSIYDLYPYRSLIGYFVKQGFDVYLIDWGKFNFQHRHLNFLDFTHRFIPDCITQIQQHAHCEQISLHGWSMAGLFASLYTASQQSNIVKNLIVLGSPIDSYASGAIGRLYQKLNQLLQHNEPIKQALYQGKLPKGLIHSSGLLNAFGFKLLDPKGWYESHKQLLLNLDSKQALQEHATLGRFLNNMIDYPGGINQDMLFHIWLQNPLARGEIVLDDQPIYLKNIHCPLLVGAGERDQIVTIDAIHPLTKLTSSSDVSFHTIPGGHLGLMSNQKSAEIFWPKLYTWLAQRSTALKPVYNQAHL